MADDNAQRIAQALYSRLANDPVIAEDVADDDEGYGPAIYESVAPLTAPSPHVVFEIDDSAIYPTSEPSESGRFTVTIRVRGAAGAQFSTVTPILKQIDDLIWRSGRTAHADGISMQFIKTAPYRRKVYDKSQQLCPVVGGLYSVFIDG